MDAPAPLLPRSLRSGLPLCCALWILARLILLIWLPVSDPIESPTAEMARKMAETGDWITPQADYGTPSWNQPAPAVWLAALGIDLFGTNGFAVRILVFGSALAAAALLGRTVAIEQGRDRGWAAATLLMACPLFFLASGAITTAVPLLVGQILVMTCFHRAMTDGGRWNGYGFFAGLALLLLCGGPEGLLLAAPPLVIGSVISSSARSAWRRLPWITGTLGLAAFTVPWFMAAEHHSPGFFRHLLATGSLGHVHPMSRLPVPLGTGVLLLLAWSLLALLPLLIALVLSRRASFPRPPLPTYWLLWTAWPLVRLLFLRDADFLDLLPVLPAAAILTAGLLPRPGWQSLPLHPAFSAACLAAALALLATLPSGFGQPPPTSERTRVSSFRSHKIREDELLFFGPHRYSADFYSEGAAVQTESTEVLAEELRKPGRLFVAIEPHTLANLPLTLQRALVPTSPSAHPDLFVERTDTPEMAGIDPSRTSPIGK